MLFTWDTTDLCVVFRWWHVRGPWSLFFTLLGVVALGMSYELLRLVARKYDESTLGAVRLGTPVHDDDDDHDRGRRSPSLTSGKYLPYRNRADIDWVDVGISSGPFCTDSKYFIRICSCWWL